MRPGESKRVLWVAAIGLCYAAATSLGENISESVLFSRIGWHSMPLVILLKAGMDILAAALYLPLTKKRNSGRVWRIALLIYIVTVAIGGTMARGESDYAAYILYVGHECTWTILTIHWGVFILEAFDASQARRLFPLLFTTARVGSIIAGLLLTALAQPVGALNLIIVVVGLAGLAAALSYGMNTDSAANPGDSLRLTVSGHDQTAADDDDVDSADGGLWQRWRAATRSPLVRAIAISTAAMVIVRWGLYITSFAEIRDAFNADTDDMATFLGVYRALANTAGVVLGLLVVPWLFSRLGVAFANLAYAASTALAFGVMLLFPSLGAAVCARFTHSEFKTALKTPLSTLFYGAEVPAQRAPARAFIFGTVIPLASVMSAALIWFSGRDSQALVVTAQIGLGVAVLFVLASALQNQRWRERMLHLLGWKLKRTPLPASQRASELLAQYRTDANAERLAAIAQGLSSDDPRLRAVAEEVLVETIPRAEAHAIAKQFS